MQIFEYAVIKNEKRGKNGEVTDKGEILVSPTTLLAKDQAEATIIANRAIPQNVIDAGELDRVSVVVRPF